VNAELRFTCRPAFTAWRLATNSEATAAMMTVKMAVDTSISDRVKPPRSDRRIRVCPFIIRPILPRVVSVADVRTR